MSWLTRLDEDRAAELVRTVLDALRREYPHRPTGRWRRDSDVRAPRQAHPAFHGAVDWHSAVHGLWALARLARRLPGLDESAHARALLSARLTGRALAVERRLLARDPSFERPYGWAWLLQLATELETWEEADPDWPAALAPVTDLVAGRAREWLAGAGPYPDRCGAHANSAFAVLLWLRHARRTGRDDLEQRCVAAARSWFRDDRRAPAAYEPSAGDFLSPILTEAHLMSAVAGGAPFAEWYERFLPDTGQVVPVSLREPPLRGDPADPVAVHRHGLTLSRAWSWRAIGAALPARDPQRAAALDAADAHLAHGAGAVPTGELAGDHWLVSFLLLAVDGL